MNPLKKKAYELSVEVYTLTSQLPKYEQMVMALMLKRLSLSVLSNTSKALSNNNKDDSLFFINYANASSHSIKSLMDMAKEIGYITEEQHSSVNEKCISLSRNIILFLKNKKDFY